MKRRDPAPRERLRLLMALAAGTTFLFWSFSSSKLPNYGLSFLAPLAVVVAVDLRSTAGLGGSTASMRNRLPCLGLAFLGAVAVTAPTLFGLTRAAGSAYQEMPDGTVLPIETFADDVWNGAVTMSAYLGGLLLVAGGLYGVITGRQTIRVLAVAASWLLVVPAGLGFWSEVDHRERPVRGFGALIREGAAREDAVVVYRKRLPSLGLYSGKVPKDAATPEELTSALAGPGRTWLVLQKKHLSALVGGAEGAAADAALDLRFETLGGSHTLVLLRER